MGSQSDHGLIIRKVGIFNWQLNDKLRLVSFIIKHYP